MNRSNRMKPIAHVAQHHERTAARQLGVDLNRVEQQKQMLQTLLEHREAYLKAYKQAGKDGLTAVQMHDFRLFIRRIDEAIHQQRQKLVSSERNCQESRAQWRDRRDHSEKIDKIIESRKAIEKQAREKQERREQDDRPVQTGKTDLP